MKFSLLSLLAATLFVSVLVGLNAYPRRHINGSIEQHDYGWPAKFYGEWGVRKDGSFTALAKGFYVETLLVNVAVALGGAYVLLRLPIDRLVRCKANVPDPRPAPPSDSKQGKSSRQ